MKNETLTHHSEIKGNSAFRPWLLWYLVREKMQPMIDMGKNIAGGKDVALIQVLPGMKFAVGLTPRFMDLVLKNHENFVKPDAAEAQELMGGGGVLSMSARDNEPYQRTAGRSGVQEFFNKRMNSTEFAEDLKNRVGKLLRLLTQEPEIPYEETMKRVRLEYLKSLYFGDDITATQMVAVYQYVESVFNSLLSLSIKKGQKDRSGKDWREFAPKNVHLLQQKAEPILLKVIEERLEHHDFGDDLFGAIMADIVPHWQDQSSIKMKREIISGFLQVLFASGDTTPSGIGSIFKALAENTEIQETLRQSAQRVAAKKENQLIEFADFNQPDPDMIELMKFVGHTIVENPPTPTTARKNLHDLVLADGSVIPAGTNIFLILGEAQLREWQQKGTDIEKFADLMNLKIFGTGKTVCVGRPFALHEIMATTIYALNLTRNISLADPDSVERVVGATLRHENLLLNIEPAK